MRYKFVLLSLLSFIILLSSLHSVSADHAGFTEQTTITSTITNPRGLFLGDLDNDGYVDVVSSDATNGNLNWYKNNGDNTFALPVFIAPPVGNPYSIYGADLNNDGYIDLLSASYDDDSINWFKNNGNGTFTVQTPISTTADGASSVYAADLNNDGFVDVISGSSIDTRIVWYLNNGNETFTEQLALSILAGTVTAVLAADIDKDGFVDIVSTDSLNNEIYWFLNNGNNTFSEQTPISITALGVSDAFLADLDNDGYVDVLTANTAENVVAWYKNNAGASFTEQTPISTLGLGVNSVIASDLDDDGDMDVISGSFNDDTIRLFLNIGNSTFTVQTDISTTVSGPLNLAVGDLDNNGSNDLVCISNLDSSIRYFTNNQVYSYTVEYLDYDNTVLQTTDYEFGTDLSLEVPPVNPQRTGYTFVEWDAVLPSTMPANDITITATYTINQYTVEYLDFDNTVLQTTDYDFETDLSLEVPPLSPERTGYTFLEWDAVLPLVMPANDITITATYAINQYTVEYQDYDGSIIQTTDYDFETDLSLEVPPLSPERTGYTFVEWDAVLPLVMPANNIIITATYAINQYTVEYQDYDGTVLQFEVFDFESDISGIIAPTTPYRKGYTFDSWDIVLPAVMEANDITLTAIYSTNQYLVEYRDYDGTIIQSQIFDYLSDLTVVTQPVHPTREGYNFIGWDRALPSLMGTTDIIITARYIDSEIPIITGLSNYAFNQSEAESFTVPLVEVTDNLDTDLLLSVTFFKGDGITELEDLDQVILEIKAGNNIVIKYNVSDNAGNSAVEVITLITTVDDIAPTVEGVINNQVFERKSTVTITFSDGTAKLNGRDFSSGSTIDTSNTYRLVVTDSAGNVTIINFEIQDVSTSLVIGMTGILLGVMVAGIVVIKIKKIF